MFMLSICSVNVGYSFRTPLRTFALYLWYISLFSADHSLKKKTGLENLEQSIYLCILWLWILNTASNYQLYLSTFLNILLSYMLVNFYPSVVIIRDMGYMEIDIEYPPDTLFWG